MSCGVPRFCYADSDYVLSFSTDPKATYSRRAWVISQLALLIRNASIPKADAWVFLIIDWFTLNGLFVITRKNEKSDLIGVNSNTFFEFTVLIFKSSCAKYRNLPSLRI